MTVAATVNFKGIAAELTVSVVDNGWARFVEIGHQSLEAVARKLGLDGMEWRALVAHNGLANAITVDGANLDGPLHIGGNGLIAWID